MSLGAADLNDYTDISDYTGTYRLTDNRINTYRVTEYNFQHNTTDREAWGYAQVLTMTETICGSRVSETTTEVWLPDAPYTYYKLWGNHLMALRALFRATPTDIGVTLVRWYIIQHSDGRYDYHDVFPTADRIDPDWNFDIEEGDTPDDYYAFGSSSLQDEPDVDTFTCGVD